MTVFQVQFSKDGNYLYTGGRKVKPCAEFFLLNLFVPLFTRTLELFFANSGR